MRRRGLLLIAAGLLIAADAPKDDATKKEPAKLLGTWRVQSAERDGQPPRQLGWNRVGYDAPRP